MNKISNLAAATAVFVGSVLPAQADDKINPKAVAENTYYAETNCRPTMLDPTRNAEICLDSIETAIRSLAAYQLDVSENPLKYGFVYEAYGEMGNEIRFKRQEGEKDASSLITESMYRGVRDNYPNEGSNLQERLRHADAALKTLFAYAGQGSFGIHPEAMNVGTVIERVWQSAQSIEVASPLVAPE